MARYFQAPVMQPVDYGYSMPFQEKMAYLQQQQGLQDEGRTAVESLYDVGQLNALKQDYAERDKLINQRYDEVDQLMTDDKGNLRDFRNIKPAVTAIARRRAKEEQSGGKWSAIASNYAAAQAYQKDISDMHSKGEIGIKRRDALISDAFSSYAGIGEKDMLGAYNTFSGRTAAKEVDDITIAYDYAKDVAFQKIQAAGLITKDGRLLTDTEAEAQMNSPEFKTVMGGMYVQTGSVEYRTMETIKRVTESALYSNNQLKEDILQEAWQNGYTTPEMQEAYYDEKINILAVNAADKYASTKFDPKLTKNWMLEKQIELKNGKTLIDYEKQKESNTMEWNTATNKYKIEKPQELQTKIKAGNERVKFLQEDIARLESKENRTAEENDLLDSHKSELSRTQVQVNGWNEQQKSVGKTIVAQKGEGYIYGKAEKAAVDYFTNNVSGSFANTTAEVKAFKAGLKDLFANSGVPEEDIAAAMLSGDLFAMDFNGQKLGEAIQDLATESGVTFSQPFLYNQVSKKDHNKAVHGENIDMSHYLQSDIRTINNSGGFEMDQDATAMMASEGAQKDYNEGLTTMVVNGQADMLMSNGKGDFDYNKMVKGLKAKSIGKSEVFDVKEPHPITGEPQALLVVNYKDKNDKPKQHRVLLTPPAGTNTSSAMVKNKRIASNQKIENALTRKHDPVAVRDLQEGASDYGMTKFVGTDIQQVDNLDIGETKMVIIPGSEDAPIYFAKALDGTLRAGYATPDGNGGWLKPDFQENQGLIYDVRTWTQTGEGGQYKWKDAADFIQNYGWVAYNVETNRFENPYNRK
jgi:hypothetical protein